MQFGDREDILSMADDRLKRVRKKFPNASLLNPDAVSVIYLVAFDPSLYSDYAVAQAHPGRGGISRSVALRKMMGPIARMMHIG
jgi:formate dehydrogenase iron-sulfur subunit